MSTGLATTSHFSGKARLPRRGLADGLVRLRRGNQARWVDPLAESARYEQLLAEGFTAQTTRA